MGLRDCFLIITFVGSSLAGWVHGAALREECRSVSSFSDVVKHVFSGYIRLNGSRDNRMSNCYVCVTGQDGSGDGATTSGFGLYTWKRYDIDTVQFTNHGSRFRFREFPSKIRALELMGDFDLSCLPVSNCIEYLSWEFGQMRDVEDVRQMILKLKDVRVLHYSASKAIHEKDKNPMRSQCLDLACLQPLEELEELYLDMDCIMKNMQTLFMLRSLKHAELRARWCTPEYARDEIVCTNVSNGAYVKLCSEDTRKFCEDAFMGAKKIHLVGGIPLAWVPQNNSVVEELTWEYDNGSGCAIDWGWISRLKGLKYLGIDIKCSEFRVINMNELIRGHRFVTCDVRMKNCVPSGIDEIPPPHDDELLAIAFDIMIDRQ